MTKFEMYAKFSVVHEKQLPIIEAENEFEALTEAYEKEEGIVNELVDEYGDSVVVEEFIANPVGEPENKTTM
ncbi:MAG: hypothetical protein PHG06_00575 [Parabacteroides sp.]|nr:hypothetical protein [Parabacteroides sp.]